MRIERATRADAQAILEHWMDLAAYHAALDPVFTLSESGPEAFGRFLIDTIDSEEAIVLVAREAAGDPVAGFAMARVVYDPPIFACMPRGEILDFYVRPPSRRRGVGTAMLAEIESWFAERGIARLEVRVYRGNSIGYPFWKKSGFDAYLDILSRDRRTERP